MTWEEVRQLHPHCWVVIEAIGAYNEGIHRQIPEMGIVRLFGDDGTAAMLEYSRLQKLHRQLEFHFFHTDRVELNIELMNWRGQRIDATGRPLDIPEEIQVTSVHEY
jgi:hypothetical protein